MSEMQPHQWPLSMRPKRVPTPTAPKSARESRPATEEQLRFARDLGLTLRDATTENIMAEIERRGIPAILLTWTDDVDNKCDLSCGGMTLDEAKELLAQIGHHLMRDRSPRYDAIIREYGESGS